MARKYNSDKDQRYVKLRPVSEESVRKYIAERDAERRTPHDPTLLGPSVPLPRISKKELEMLRRREKAATNPNPEWPLELVGAIPDHMNKSIDDKVKKEE